MPMTGFDPHMRVTVAGLTQDAHRAARLIAAAPLLLSAATLALAHADQRSVAGQALRAAVLAATYNTHDEGE
jgi:hypothetical protein